jgi:MoxR-like ATPase
MEQAMDKSSSGFRILRSVAKAIVGKDEVIMRVFLAMLARGHVLIEDIPGVGKTTLAIAFSKALTLDYNRVQFTPDVLPSDITGYSVINKDTGNMEYTPGAVLCNLFLADELNRANSRTQSALLEVMEEAQVTVDGNTYTVPQPFIVIATQNPVGAAGTQLLPDSQMDRFMVCLTLGYPQYEDEMSLVTRKQSNNLLDLVEPELISTELESMRSDVDNVHLDKKIVGYIVDLISATRIHPLIYLGASPRATLALTSMSKAMAYLQGRDYVIPDDINPVFVDTLSHRLILKSSAASENATAASILKDILMSTKVPQVHDSK